VTRFKHSNERNPAGQWEVGYGLFSNSTEYFDTSSASASQYLKYLNNESAVSPCFPKRSNKDSK